MGEWMRPTSVKLGPRAERELSEIMDAFDPFFASRSHVIRWLTGLMHGLIFCERNLEEFAQMMQGVQRSTARYKSSSLTAVPKNGARVTEAPKLGPQRVDCPQAQPDVRSGQKLTTQKRQGLLAGSWGAAAMEAWFSPFIVSVGPRRSQFIRLERIVA